MDGTKKRGRKPNQTVSPKANKKKKRGRKKKCEMNLENTDKMKDFITYFDTTENNELRFDTLNEPKDSPGAPSAHSAGGEAAVDDEEEVEEIRFGGIVIKKHKTSEPNTTELHRNFIRKNNDNCKNNNNEIDQSTSICEIDLDLITVKDNNDSDTSDDDDREADVRAADKVNYTKKTISSKGTKFKSKKVGVSDLIQVQSSKNNELIEKKTKINKRNDYNYLETMTIMKHYGDDVNEWPQETEVLCWWCCHPFKTPPAFIPTQFDSINKRYKITGNFCTWNCAKSYLFGEKEFQNRQSKHLFTRLLLTLKIPYDIKPAPPRLTLKTFGGPLSIEEFREHSLYRETGKFKVSTNKMVLDDECKIKHYF